MVLPETEYAKQLPIFSACKQGLTVLDFSRLRHAEQVFKLIFIFRRQGPKLGRGGITLMPSTGSSFGGFEVYFLLNWGGVWRY